MLFDKVVICKFKRVGYKQRTVCENFGSENRALNESEMII